MLLKRLEVSLPPHCQRLLAHLDKSGIKTTENLLFTPLDTILSLLPPHIAEEEENLNELIERCLRSTAPQSVTGDTELDNAQSGGDGRLVQWDVEGLDGLLGGWDGKGVVEICGPQRVGKSLLSLHAALRLLVNDRNAKVKWLDSDGSFSQARARSILDLWDIQKVDEVLSRLSVSPCYNIDPDLWKVLEAIKEEHADDGTIKTRMLVVDSVVPLLKDHLTGLGSQGHAAMTSMMEELAELAYTSGLSIIATNSSSSYRPSNPQSAFTATDLKPSLGVSFTFFSDITLLLQSTGKVFGEIDQSERDRMYDKPGLRGVVEVLKSRISVTGKWAVFETDGKSLSDVLPAPLDDERNIKMTAGHGPDDHRPKYGPLRETLAPL